MTTFAEIQDALKKISKWPWADQYQTGIHLILSGILHHTGKRAAVATLERISPVSTSDASFIAKTPEYVDFLLQALIKAEARAMKAEFYKLHLDFSTLTRTEKTNPDLDCFNEDGSPCDKEEHDWSDSDWEREAEKKLREER